MVGAIAQQDPEGTSLLSFGNGSQAEETEDKKISELKQTKKDLGALPANQWESRWGEAKGSYYSGILAQQGDEHLSSGVQLGIDVQVTSVSSEHEGIKGPVQSKSTKTLS